MSMIDGDWIDGRWDEVPATAPMSTPLDPEAIAAHEGRPRPLDEAVALGLSAGDRLPALVRLHGQVRAGHRRWLALAGVIALGRAAERGETIDPEATLLWNDAIRRDPSRHPGLRGEADAHRRILGAALAKIAAADPAAAEAMLLRGLAAEPADDFRAEALATFRHVGRAPSPKVQDAAQALLRRVEDARRDDDEGHIRAGVESLPNAGAFVAAYLEAGGGRRHRDLLVAAVPKQDQAALAPDDGDAEVLRRIAREMSAQSNPPFASVRLASLAVHLRALMEDADVATKRRIAWAPVLADDPEVTRLLLEEGDSRQFELGAGRLLVRGAELEPAWAERAKSLVDPRSFSPASLELLARVAPDALHELVPKLLEKMDWKQNPSLLYTVIGAIAALESRDSKLDARLRRMAKDNPTTLLPIAAAGGAKKAVLEQLVTPVGWMATPAGALLGVPNVADAIIAHLESVEPNPRLNLFQGLRALERMGAGKAIRERWLDTLCTIHRDTDDTELARWAASMLAYVRPGAERLDAIVEAMQSPKRRARPDGALLQLVAALGDARAIDLVEGTEPAVRKTLLRMVVDLDLERVLALANELAPTPKTKKDERDDLLYYLTPLVARGPKIPDWVPKASISKSGKPARLGHADIDAKERTKLFRELCDNGWYGYGGALRPARQALARFPEAMRAVLEKEASGDDALRAFVAREALALGPGEEAWTAGEPTSGFAHELPGQWHRWFSSPHSDYVAPFHPSWTERVLGMRAGVASGG
ncbi:hypothetical protein [Paraliomyxa miuraensis]|uniref:hypothetical protein n=1 Tax=Paraliomyxa miuraensis TaxID=376150 RepID=UPI002253E133|nr:hypothetical protein [Paraliomyxa miuraensis]MCX4246163.1 hypothetical protein [Paraliomyxa miuraensis]